MTNRIVAAMGLLAVACGGGVPVSNQTPSASPPNASPPNASAAGPTGTIGGKAFLPVEGAVSSYMNGTMALVLSNTANFTSTVQNGYWPREWSGLRFDLFAVDGLGRTVAPTPGAYEINAPGSRKIASARYSVEDQACNENLAERRHGVSGSVVLISSSSGAWSGTYDVTFDNGDRVTGPFSTSFAPVLGNFISTCDPIPTAAVSGTVSNISGTIHQNAFAPMDAAMNVRVSSVGGTFAQITLYDRPAICAAAQSFNFPRGFGVLTIDLATSATDDTSTSTPPVALGTYPVLANATAGPGSGGAFYREDSNFDIISADSSQVRGGSVTLTSIAGGTYVGSYDFVMDTGERITGSFSAPYCPAL